MKFLGRVTLTGMQSLETCLGLKMVLRCIFSVLVLVVVLNPDVLVVVLVQVSWSHHWVLGQVSVLYLILGFI